MAAFVAPEQFSPPVNLKAEQNIKKEQIEKIVYNLPKPDKIKAVHLAYDSYLNSPFKEILGEIENSQINAIVFEIKNPTGLVTLNSKRHLEALEELIPKLNEAGIYTIARMVVFQDSYLTEERPDLAIQNSQTGGIWRDYKNVAWSDPTNPAVWQYNLDIMQKAAEAGFNEINLDYIRFPSDGPVRQAVYNNLENSEEKVNVIGNFLKFVRENLRSDVVLSIDVFGMIFISDQAEIGQSISKMAPHVDVIMPMSYPSHYPPNFRGLENPADHPYVVVFRTLEKGFEQLRPPRDNTSTSTAPEPQRHEVIVRPWIQDFDLGAVYDDYKIQEQIRAASEFEIYTWALWNASSRYTWSAVR